ncbi:MAG TPA: GntR family transcriptional regulator, partial [Gaiellaceae bacterium]|nr:GntR family transcriptional regulator [Gaiellaceae bacterium]
RDMTVALARTNLNDQVYETLKRRLVRRELGPGEKVSLHELADELGVSRSPVHHALTRLVSEGLLTVKSRRGYYVTPLTEAAIAEGYEVRLALELQAAEAAVGRVGHDELRGFRERHETTAAAVSHAEWDAANAAFHEYQVDLAANTLLSRFYRELSVNLMMQVIRGGKLEGGSYLPTEHGAIVDAYEAGDLAAAQAAIRAHIVTGRRIALDAIESTGGVL